jgi:fumarate reductase flavoprotein subunit
MSERVSQRSIYLFEQARQNSMEQFTCEVLVAGAGLAGFTAATRAAEAGVRVLLIDKSDGELGDGNILMASGSLRAGGKNPRTDPKELYDFVMAEGIGYPELVRAWSETCNRAVDWLIASGVKISESAPGRVWLDQSGEVSLAPVYKKDVGTRALTSLRRKFDQLGGSYLAGVAAEELMAEKGRIVGVRGKRGGVPIELRARATILSTGGFSANKELVRRYIGTKADQCKLRGSKQDTGDGLRMAQAAGAKAVNLQYFYGHLISRKALVDDRFWPYPRLDSFVDEGILVDPRGERFVDEGRGDVAVANELARAEDPTEAVLIFDRESWEASRDDALSNSVKTPAPNPWLMENGGELFTRPTIEELAQTLGIPSKRLSDTLKDYNNAIEAHNEGSMRIGRTGKAKPLRAPFYGLRVVPGITFTMGGILINDRGESLDESERPIPGLYAAGDAIGGLMGGYRGGYTGGLMQAVVTGILAGENAAGAISSR